MTDNPLTEVPGPPREVGGPGTRIRRLERRRRMVREELLAVAVLLVFLAITVAVLATQWLDSGPSANAAGWSHIPNSLYLNPYGGAT
ncbi:MAG TPA: hypothetical protein VFH58_14520 [Acidimicrobiales bacterium]|nr:hypothetical protein [Acidimicrobiales bacterium]